MTDEAISPLRLRMIEDMTVRGFAAGTQRGYIAAIKRFTIFLGRSPDEVSAEDLRRYQLHMRSIEASATSINAAVSALRFFFGMTLGRGDAQAGMTTVREPRKLPVMLSPEEVTRHGSAQDHQDQGLSLTQDGARHGLHAALERPEEMAQARWLRSSRRSHPGSEVRGRH
jgi:site-specific recombinase XerD